MDNQHASTPIAVIGMACRTPGADNLDEYWRLIREGRSAIGPVPNDRLNRELYYTTELGVTGKSYTEIGGVVSDRPFDPKSCVLSDDMVKTHDISHLNICEVAATSLRHGRMDTFNLPQRNVGVYIGHAGGSSWAGDMVCAIGIEETANYLFELDQLRELGRDRIVQMGQSVCLWMFHDLRDGEKRRYKAPGLPWQTQLPVVRAPPLAQGLVDSLIHTVFPGIVRRQSQFPVPVAVVQIPQQAGRGAGRGLGIHPLIVPGPAHAQPELAGSGGRELPQAHRARGRPRAGVEIALDGGQIGQFGRHPLVGENSPDHLQVAPGASVSAFHHVALFLQEKADQPFHQRITAQLKRASPRARAGTDAGRAVVADSRDRDGGCSSAVRGFARQRQFTAGSSIGETSASSVSYQTRYQPPGSFRRRKLGGGAMEAGGIRVEQR